MKKKWPYDENKTGQLKFLTPLLKNSKGATGVIGFIIYEK